MNTGTLDDFVKILPPAYRIKSRDKREAELWHSESSK